MHGIFSITWTKVCEGMQNVTARGLHAEVYFVI
jgi:hypothetical protein